MKNISQSVKRVHDYGSYTYATVESIGLNKATVVLKNSNAKLTNLPVAGSRIEVGDTVIVDYSSGKPVVRPITSHRYDISESGMFGFESQGFSGFPSRPMKPFDPNDWSPIPEGNPTDMGASVWAFAYTEMDARTELNIQFRATNYDTNEFFGTAGDDYITTKMPGLYIAIARVGWDANAVEDTKYYTSILVDGDQKASIITDTISGSPNTGRIYELSTALVCLQNSTVSMKVKQNNNFAKQGSSVKISMSSDDTYHMYPSLQLQWIGVVV